jgi:hypothetical protein
MKLIFIDKIHTFQVKNISNAYITISYVSQNNKTAGCKNSLHPAVRIKKIVIENLFLNHDFPNHIYTISFNI